MPNRFFSIVSPQSMLQRKKISVSIVLYHQLVCFSNASSDGVYWNYQPTGFQNLISGIAYGNQTFIAVVTGGVILTSQDGQTWVNQNIDVPPDVVCSKPQGVSQIPDRNQRSSVIDNRGNIHGSGLSVQNILALANIKYTCMAGVGGNNGVIKRELYYQKWYQYRHC